MSLTDQIGDGLSSIERTIDGKGYAFTKLELRDKELTDLGTALDALVHVRFLDLSKNKLTAIPSFRALRSLLSACLDENDLTELPSITDLAYLQVLVVNNNLITSLTGARSDSLVQLSVNGNQLSSFAELGPLPLLRRLEASWNTLTSLHTLPSLPMLQELIVNNNKITSLKGLDGCLALRLAVASKNALTTLDDVNWRQFPWLKTLYIDDNNIEAPSALAPLAACKPLKKLFLSGNPIASVDNYKTEVLIQLPGLQELDGVKITQEDRQAAEEEIARRREEEEEAKRKESDEGKMEDGDE